MASIIPRGINILDMASLLAHGQFERQEHVINEILSNYNYHGNQFIQKINNLDSVKQTAINFYSFYFVTHLRIYSSHKG